MVITTRAKQKTFKGWWWMDSFRPACLFVCRFLITNSPLSMIEPWGMWPHLWEKIIRTAAQSTLRTPSVCPGGIAAQRQPSVLHRHISVWAQANILNAAAKCNQVLWSGKEQLQLRVRLARRWAAFRFNVKPDNRFHRNKGYVSGSISLQLVNVCVCVCVCVCGVSLPSLFRIMFFHFEVTISSFHVDILWCLPSNQAPPPFSNRPSSCAHLCFYILLETGCSHR